jgi:3-mercaptopyruvate sulfurtransferase SseA
VAQQLKALGVQRVRPLAGGFHGWKKLNFPLTETEGVQWRVAV